jgi:hypothetical protein
VSYAETQHNARVKRIKLDNGGEYVSERMQTGKREGNSFGVYGFVYSPTKRHGRETHSNPGARCESYDL